MPCRTKGAAYNEMSVHPNARHSANSPNKCGRIHLPDNLYANGDDNVNNRTDTEAPKHLTSDPSSYNVSCPALTRQDMYNNYALLRQINYFAQ